MALCQSGEREPYSGPEALGTPTVSKLCPLYESHLPSYVYAELGVRG